MLAHWSRQMMVKFIVVVHGSLNPGVDSIVVQWLYNTNQLVLYPSFHQFEHFSHAEYYLSSTNMNNKNYHYKLMVMLGFYKK
jgi:hypothetical protein